LKPEELRRRDADYRQWKAIHVDGLAERINRPSKLPLPKAITNDGQRLFEIQVGECPASDRLYAEQREVVRGYILAFCHLRFSACALPELDRPESQNVREGLALLTERLEQQIIGPRRRILVSPVRKNKEFLRMAHRQRAKQDCVQEAEDRNVGSNPESQRKDSCQCETRASDQPSPSIPGVLQ
jgi:hypothetical protein